MKITIQYFEGCPHWRLADERVRNVLRDIDPGDAVLDHQLIDSPETAARVGFHGSPTILVDGQDPFATGNEPVGMSCRVFSTEVGAQGAPTEAQITKAITAKTT